MPLYKYVLLLHVLSATIWTGGHMVLCFAVLPRALMRRSAEIVRRFEESFEGIGIPSLLVQVVTGFYLAYQVVPDVGEWFAFDDFLAKLVFAKIACLVATLALAIHARFRILPTLDDESLTFLAGHILAVTLLSIAFVVLGVAFHVDGFQAS